MTATGGDLADTNGVAGLSIPVIAFRSGAPNNSWNFVGYITNNVASPTVKFAYASGAANSTPSRWYFDAVRFEYQDPCTGVAPQLGVAGPLVAGQVFVNVTGVAGTATNVTVYANGSQIGSTNYAPGFAAGGLTVTTTALVKNDVITAGQTATNALGGACIGSVPGSGPLVGGGPNPGIKVFLGCWQNSAFAGPVGADTTTGLTVNTAINATGLTSGFNSAPSGGVELFADQCWHTVTFNHATDAGRLLGNGNAITDSNPFAALEGLIFAMDENNPDTGPYDIYVDQIKNGETVIEDFETYTAGTGATFNDPNASGAPPVGATYLSAPNSSLISTANAYDGTKSCRIQWQWADASVQRWAHVLANATVGKHYPQLDTHQPITIRYLVLPVGASLGTKFNGTLSNITNSGPSYTTGTNTLGVTVTGPGSYTYFWTLNGNGLPNTTSASAYTIGDPSGINSSDNGIYQVDVSDGTCSESRTYAFTNIDPIATITNQPSGKTIAHVGDNVSFTVGGDGHITSGYPLSYQWKFNGADITDATDATFSTNSVQVVNAGSYTVGVSNSFGGTLSPAAVLDVVQPGVVIGTGTGLRGNYYTSHFSTNAFSGVPTLTRIDPTVDFNFGSGSPDPGISSDFFTIRWLGEVQALDTDTYTFYTTSDDGVRLWVNGQLLVNSWILQGPTEHGNTIALNANQKYNLLLEYFENAVGAVAQLRWAGASGGVAKEIIPMTQLYPATASATNLQSTVAFALSNGTNLVLNFGPGSFTLQSAANVTGPYSTIAYGVLSPFTVTNAIGSGPQMFYRLKVQ
jgi:hypothetical protein